MTSRILREPLVHFLVLGAIVFAIFQVGADANGAPEGKIVVTTGKLEHLATGFSRTWRRAPTRQELDFLVEDYVREEVLYREAVAMGLDKDDTIVRRRLRQKLEFVAGDTSAMAAPTEADLQGWLERNPDKFAVEPGVAFAQVYFNPARHGDSAPAIAANALARLRKGAQSSAGNLGDATTLPSDMPLSSVSEVGRVFGEPFAREVAQRPPGVWSGPLQSGYGWHLVRVDERTAGGSRPLSEVREAVQREWLAARNKEIVESTYRRLREKYAVVIEGTQTP